MGRIATIGGLFLASIGVLLAALAVSAAPSPQPAPTLHVLAGWGGPAVVVDEFLPDTLRITEGTTVTWTQNTLRAHTITFLAGNSLPRRDIPQPEDPSLPRMRNPLAEFATLPQGPYDGTYFINSGIMEAGESFSVTFSTAGVYPFVCIPHETMIGTIEVVPPGSPGITAQEDVDRYILAESARWEAQIAELLAARSEPIRLDNPDGTVTWFVRNGADAPTEPDGRVGRLTLRAYFPDSLTVRQGDSVVWYADTRVPVHTITFALQGDPPRARWEPRFADGNPVPLEMLSPTGAYRGDPNSFGWPRIVEDASILAPSRPSPVYDPGRYFNSGQMGNDPRVGRAWSLTFEAPGTFSYYCIPHVDIGQIGQITVVPR